MRQRKERHDRGTDRNKDDTRSAAILELEDKQLIAIIQFELVSSISRTSSSS